MRGILITDLSQLEYIVQVEFGDLVVSSAIDLDKLRINLVDESFVEVFNSYPLPDRWAFQWERRHVDGSMYRHDNIPHSKWKKISFIPGIFITETRQVLNQVILAMIQQKTLDHFSITFEIYLDKMPCSKSCWHRHFSCTIMVQD